MEKLCSVKRVSSDFFATDFSDECYHIILLKGRGKIFIDLVEYDFSEYTILFTTPYQNFKIITPSSFEVVWASFHGDFYCIEYHKKEVACNGLLFNNIYLFPHFNLEKEVLEEIEGILDKISALEISEPYADAVMKSYLQVVLALSSKKKNQLLDAQNLNEDFHEVKRFQNLVEQYFIQERSPSFYAEKLHISPNALSKKIRREFAKTPSQIIQERVILEAKKQIHLTRKSIKEIAAELHFDDELYFSKYFKKHTQVSPSQFRDAVGISIVADQ